MDTSDASSASEVLGQTAFWALLPIAFNAMGQSSNIAKSFFNARTSSSGLLVPSLASPIMCLAETALDCWMLLRTPFQRRSITTVTMEEANLRGDGARRKDSVAVRVVLFVFGVVPQAVRLFGMSGIALTQVLATIYLSTAVVRVLTLVTTSPEAREEMQASGWLSSPSRHHTLLQRLLIIAHVAFYLLVWWLIGQHIMAPADHEPWQSIKNLAQWLQTLATFTSALWTVCLMLLVLFFPLKRSWKLSVSPVAFAAPFGILFDALEMLPRAGDSEQPDYHLHVPFGFNRDLYESALRTLPLLFVGTICSLILATALVRAYRRMIHPNSWLKSNCSRQSVTSDPALSTKPTTPRPRQLPDQKDGPDNMFFHFGIAVFLCIVSPSSTDEDDTQATATQTHVVSSNRAIIDQQPEPILTPDLNTISSDAEEEIMTHTAATPFSGSSPPSTADGTSSVRLSQPSTTDGIAPASSTHTWVEPGPKKRQIRSSYHRWIASTVILHKFCASVPCSVAEAWALETNDGTQASNNNNVWQMSSITELAAPRPTLPAENRTSAPPAYTEYEDEDETPRLPVRANATTIRRRIISVLFHMVAAVVMLVLQLIIWLFHSFFVIYDMTIYVRLYRATVGKMDETELWIAFALFNLLTTALYYFVAFDGTGTSNPGWTNVLSR